MATDTIFGTPTPIPQDESPEWVPPTDTVTVDFDPEFPGSTREAPFGFKADGTPRKRRPNGTGSTPRVTGSRPRNTPANPTTARSAAGLLARVNQLVGLALYSAGLEDTAEELKRQNEQFEELAYEALLTDPQLCKKILGAGATSGKAGLVMAYTMLGISIAPTARTEILDRRKAREIERGNTDD